MKMNYEIKQKMPNQRLKRMKSFFNAYGLGDKIFLEGALYEKELQNYYILACHELDGEFYYVLGGANGNIFIGKVVCNDYAGIIKVPEETPKYNVNKEVFDGWINAVKEGGKSEILRCYFSLIRQYKGKIISHTIIVANKQKTIDAKLLLTKEYNGKYYFVIKHSNKNYFVTNLIWEGGSVIQKVLKAREFREDREVFNNWIVEAKRKEKKDKKYGKE